MIRGRSQRHDSGLLWTPPSTPSIAQAWSSGQLVAITARGINNDSASAGQDQILAERLFLPLSETNFSSFPSSPEPPCHKQLAWARRIHVIARLLPGQEQRAPCLQILQLLFVCLQVRLNNLLSGDGICVLAEQEIFLISHCKGVGSVKEKTRWGPGFWLPKSQPGEVMGSQALAKMFI